MSVPSLVALLTWGRGTEKNPHQRVHGVIKLLCRRTVLERPAKVGKSPVSETHAASVSYSQVTPGP